MKSITRWYRERYVLPVKQAVAVKLLKSLLPDLLVLRKHLIDIASHEKKAEQFDDEHLTLMVLFFMWVKPWIDNGRVDSLLKTFQDAEEAGCVAQFFCHASYARDERYIRSKPGEQVSCNKIFLGGNRPNVPRRSIAEWKQEKGNTIPVAMTGGGESLSAYQVILGEARNFVDAHALPLVLGINELEDFAREYDLEKAA